MLDHTGRLRVRYEDALRALGNYLDNHHFTQIALIETPEGFVVKGFAVVDQVDSDSFHSMPQTFLLSNEDIDILVEAGYQRRRAGAESPEHRRSRGV